MGNYPEEGIRQCKTNTLYVNKAKQILAETACLAVLARDFAFQRSTTKIDVEPVILRKC